MKYDHNNMYIDLPVDDDVDLRIGTRFMHYVDQLVCVLHTKVHNIIVYEYKKKKRTIVSNNNSS